MMMVVVQAALTVDISFGLLALRLKGENVLHAHTHICVKIEFLVEKKNIFVVVFLLLNCFHPTYIVMKK
jgi:hypothetical protein